MINTARMAAALTCAFGLVAPGGAALAASAPLAGKDAFQDRTGVLLIMDEETRAVEEALVPDEVPDGLEEPRAQPETMGDAAEDKSGGKDMEDEMIDKIGPGAE